MRNTRSFAATAPPTTALSQQQTPSQKQSLPRQKPFCKKSRFASAAVSHQQLFRINSRFATTDVPPTASLLQKQTSQHQPFRKNSRFASAAVSHQ
jgi:hypothetical protein